jgi:hypothetical protein
MSAKAQLLLVLVALLLTASLALAAPAAPGQAPAATVVQPLAALSPAGPVCKSGNPLVFSLDPQPATTDTCGACSDDACVGKMPNAVCGTGLRCIPGPSCSTASPWRCKCSII